MPATFPRATYAQARAVAILAGEVAPAIVWHGVQPNGDMLAETDTDPGLAILVRPDGGLSSRLDARELNARAWSEDPRRVLAWARRTVCALERVHDAHPLEVIA